MTRRRVVLIVSLTSLLVGVALGGFVEAQTTSDGNPPWVQTLPNAEGAPDGGVIVDSKLPDILPVLDSEGQAVGYVRTDDVLSGPATAEPENPNVFDLERGTKVGTLTNEGFAPVQP